MSRPGVLGFVLAGISGALVGLLLGLVVSPVRAVDGEIGTVIESGRANYATIGGPNYLAIRSPRGTTVKICGAGGCDTMVSTDYGPAKRTGDIADIALGRFARICGWSVEKARAMGECDVTIEYLGKIRLPETDTDEEWDGGWILHKPPDVFWPMVLLFLVAYVGFKRWISRRMG